MGNVLWQDTKSDSTEQDTKSDSTEVDSIIPDYETCLGRGSFGFVYKGTYGGLEVAVKVINKHMLFQRGKYENIDQNEIIPFLRGLRHPNVISILALDHGHELWLAMELCTASLDKYLKDNDPDLILTYDILRQGAAGLAYLHDNNIIHRDLRPDNELILMKDSGPIVKITDFSLSKDVDDQPTSSMTTVWGNRNWIAPEFLTEHGDKAKGVVRYKRSIDVFSYGLVILYVCVDPAGRELINRVSCGAMIKRGEDVLGKFEEHWRRPGLKERFLPLLQRMLALDPEVRPTINELFFKPLIVPTPAWLRHLASHSLEYLADWRVGIGGDGLILLGREDPMTLALLQLRAGAFQQVWEKPCPPELGWRDRKYIVGDTILTRHYQGRHPSLCWDLDLQRLHDHKAGDLMLVFCLATHVMVYREEIGYNSYQVVLCGCKMPPLRPPAGSTWGQWVSVCQHAHTGWYAVCEFFTRSLDIFDMAGCHQHHISLTYEPDLWDAICCTESHLFVRERLSAVLHIHTWSGQEVGTVDLQQVCGLSREDSVYSMGVCDSDRTLIVAVGALTGVRSLHALTIND